MREINNELHLDDELVQLDCLAVEDFSSDFIGDLLGEDSRDKQLKDILGAACSRVPPEELRLELLLQGLFIFTASVRIHQVLLL